MATPIVPQASIVRGVAFPPREALPPLHSLELQAQWDAEKLAQVDRGEAPATSLVLWCAIIAGGLMCAVAFC